MDMRLVAIFGTGRNGSTLLARLLDGIPGCYVHPAEVSFLSAMDALRRLPIVPRRVHNNSTSASLSLPASISTRRLLRYYRGQILEIEQEYSRNIVENRRVGKDPIAVLRLQTRYSPTDFVPAYLLSAGRWLEGVDGFDVSVFKTIETPYVPDYETAFPSMGFVHIIRDPVKTWASLKRTLMVSRQRPASWLGLDNLITFLEHRWIPHAKTILARKDDPRHALVRYEDLVRQPEETISNLCGRLHLPLPAEPTIQTLLGGRHFLKMQMNPSQKGVPAPAQVTQDMESLFGYTEVVTDREHALIRLRTRELGEQLGYQGDEKYTSGFDIRAAWSVFDEWDRMNVRGPHGHVRKLINTLVKRHYVRTHTRHPSS